MKRELGQHKTLHVCDRTGIAEVRDGSTGMSHSCHPNIHRTGSVAGMKKLGYWDQTDVTVTSNGYIYKVSRVVIDDNLDRVAHAHCRCGGRH